MQAWTLRALSYFFFRFATATWLAGIAAGAAWGFDNSMAERTLACTACHGAQGKAGPDGYYPRLAGKPASYLYNQLLNFREGRRQYSPMTGLIAPLSEDYLREMAQHFSSLDLPYPAPAVATAPSATLARGKTLALQGDRALGIPACVQCHGTALTGVLPATPGLLGLPRDYLNAQLGGWQTGQRKAHAPDCMAQVARKLNADDVNAVSQWLSSQPIPAHAKPVAASPQSTAGAIALPICGAPTAAPKAPAAAVTATASEVTRGAYLARIGNCALCHTASGGLPYAGGKGVDTPFGTVYASNLTPHAEAGIGRWSAQDFWRALHHGESKDGRLLYPAFPYTSYTQVTREDADALFAFLQSQPAVATPNKTHTLRWPYSTQLALRAWRTLYFTPADTPVPTAPAADPVARGAYLVNGLGHCVECHGERNALGGLRNSKSLSGATLPSGQWYAPSLAAADEAAVGVWQPADTVALLSTGMNRHATVNGPMAEVVRHSTQYWSADDAMAVARYLATLSTAPPKTTPTSGTATNAPLAGARLYEKQCAQCHGKQGEGQAGAYPALAGNRAVLMPQTNNLVLTVLHGAYGPSTAGNPQPFGMPPFMLTLSDAEISAVLTYVRGAWGNRAAAVSEFDINKIRSSQPRQEAP
jgi:mono/diheme cytochrome c family protein